MWMFIISILNFNQYKYAYGRQLRISRLLDEKIKLPVDKDGKPDWQFMERYIKSLPYSAGALSCLFRRFLFNGFFRYFLLAALRRGFAGPLARRASISSIARAKVNSSSST